MMRRAALPTAATLLALAAGPAVAAEPKATVEAKTSAETIAPAGRLRHLPMPEDGWRFAGEQARRDLVVTLGEAEAAGGATLRLALDSAVSVLPGWSRLAVEVNGRPLVPIVLDRPGRGRVVTLPVPDGLLVAGANRIRLSLRQRHRVDCSVAATWELWTALDPARSGLVLTGAPAPADLTAAIDAAGRLVLPVRLDRRPDEKDLARLADRLQATALAAGTRWPVVSPVRDAAATAEPLAVAPLAAAAGSRPASQPVATVDADTPRRLDFAEAGLDPIVFSGRRLTRGFDLVMPADFYPAPTGSVVIRLAGAHRGGLTTEARIAVAVNGATLAELPLAAGEGGVLDGRELRLPLDRFRPGRNRVSLEAVLPAEADATCDTTAEPDDRLVLLDTGTIDIPPLPRIARRPDLAATFTGRAGAATIHVPHPDEASLAAALTLATRLAVEAGRPVPLVFRFALPDRNAGRALVVAAAPDLPPGFLARFGLAGFADREARGPDPKLITGSIADQPGVQAPAAAARPDPAALYETWRRPSLLETAGRWASDLLGPLAPAAPAVAAAAPSAATTLAVVETVGPGPDAPAWTLVTARDAASLREGVAALAAPDLWRRVEGARADWAAGPGVLSTVLAAATRLEPTRPWDLANWRLVAAGWMAHRPAVYAGLLIALVIALAFTTRRLLDRVGQKDDAR